MGKDKKEKAEPAAQPRGGVGMESKRARRAAQSARDADEARSAVAWSPSLRRKDAVLPKHRCEKCHNPSAACRGGGKICARCGGSAQRSRARQAARDIRVAPPAVPQPPAAIAAIAAAAVAK